MIRFEKKGYFEIDHLGRMITSNKITSKMGLPVKCWLNIGEIEIDQIEKGSLRIKQNFLSQLIFRSDRSDRNEYFWKLPILELNDLENDRISIWSILKWLIFRSDHFFKAIIYELTYFSMWFILRSDLFWSDSFCEVTFFEATHFAKWPLKLFVTGV